MEEQNLGIISAASLRDIQVNRQSEFILKKIIEAAKNFRRECHISCDFKLNDKTIEYFKKLGYNITIKHIIEKTPYVYMYSIEWI